MQTVVIYRKGDECIILGDAAKFAARVFGLKLRTWRGTPAVIFPKSELAFREYGFQERGYQTQVELW